MIRIHVNRDRQNLGQFSPEEVAAGLVSGRFLPTDLAWREGMETWQPLATFADLPPVGEAIPPTLAPGSAEVFAESAAAEAEVFPWENRDKRGIFSALMATLTGALTQPSASFRALPAAPSLLAAYAFYLLMAIPSFAIYSAESLFFINYAIEALSTNPEIGANPETRRAFAMFKEVGTISLVVWFGFLTLVIVPCIPFVAAGAYHLLLLLFGGARESFLKSFAVTAYVFGATSPMIILPCCGPFAMIIWGLIAASAGLAAAHRTDTWRSALAVLIPFVFCCGSYFALNMLSTISHLPTSVTQP